MLMRWGHQANPGLSSIMCCWPVLLVKLYALQMTFWAFYTTFVLSDKKWCLCYLQGGVEGLSVCLLAVRLHPCACRCWQVTVLSPASCSMAPSLPLWTKSFLKPLGRVFRMKCPNIMTPALGLLWCKAWATPCLCRLLCACPWAKRISDVEGPSLNLGNWGTSSWSLVPCNFSLPAKGC